MAKTKKKPPSRLRYDQGHPTVSCRVTKDLYERLSVTYPCSECGQMINVEHQNVKEEIRGYMKEHRWGHAACHKKNS